MTKKDGKFITKQAAMMAAVSVETFLLALNYEAMLYWSPKIKYYCVIIEYESRNPLNDLRGFICNEEKIEDMVDGITKKISFYFNY
ncbi:MAG: hypothetical protein IKM77_09580 [Prevotella sp.]|nr:hypothetical protein [Prevotella sp.]